MISIDDFKKVELSIGEILSAEKVPETDKLLKLKVDFGLKLAPPAVFLVKESKDILPDSPSKEGGKEPDIRQIVSGIALYFPDPVALIGKKCLFVTNLEPRTIKGLESNGMIIAVSAEDGKFSLFEVGKDIPAGTRAK